MICITDFLQLSEWDRVIVNSWVSSHGEVFALRVHQLASVPSALDLLVFLD